MRIPILSLILVAGLGGVAFAQPYPLGDHLAHFWQGHPGPYRGLECRGLDPTIRPEDACAKAALIRGLQTFPVGLPNGVAPDDLPFDWSAGSSVVPSEISGFPTVTLSGVGEPVALISDMDFRGLGEVVFDGAMRVACLRCAFDAIRLDDGPSGEPELWLVDSLVDAGSGDPTTNPPASQSAAGVRPFDGVLHAMYSEILGGVDAAKLGNGNDFLRNHVHGVQRIDGAHVDLMQGEFGVSDLLIAENTLDGAFRSANATVFLSGSGVHYSDVDIVRNLISGGNNGIRISSGVASMTDLLLWENRWLADATHVSWGPDESSGSFPLSDGNVAVTWAEGNSTTGGVESGIDQLGRPWDLILDGVPPIPAAEKDRITARIQLLETWVVELRSASAPACCGCGTSCTCHGCPDDVTPVPSPPGPTGGACSDAIDNDGDGGIDFAGDLGCSSDWDDAETDVGIGCDDGVDNDDDGQVDYPADSGCASACSGRENPACSNGLDDDGDGDVDHPADPGCAAGSDISESSDLLVCDDGVDQDDDALVDFPADPGCDSNQDASERSPSLVCDDGIDNDGDSENDVPDDPGCESVLDPDETSAALACDDGVDNDADGAADYPQDPGCNAPGEFSEREPGRPCDDGSDNDGDGAFDFPADTGCANPSWASEVTACSDEIDNDGDGALDFPGDPDCSGASDLSERGDSPACANLIDDDQDGLADFGADAGCSSASDVSERDSTLVCDNGLDDDGDGLRDHPADPGCGSVLGASEIGTPGVAPACDDGVDSDGDALVDLDDPGCSGAADPSESTPHLHCDDDLDNDADLLVDHPADPDCSHPGDVSEGAVADAFAPEQSAVVVLVSAASATLAWKTDETARARVAYSSAGAPSQVVEGSDWEVSHSVRIDGLACDQVLWFEASSDDPSGNRSVSQWGSLSTLPCASDEGLVGWWRLEEGNGLEAADASDGGPAASLLGPVWELESADGSDFSLSFDGVDDVLDLGLRNVSGSEITLAAWAKVRQFTGVDRTGRLLSKAVGIANSEHFWMLSTIADGPVTRLRSRIRAGASTELTSADSGEVVLGRWIHAAVVYDGSEVRIYQDGVEVAREASSGALDEAPAVSVAAGNQPPGAGLMPLNGLLDDLRIYRRALGAVEIAALYGGQAMVASEPAVVATPMAAAIRWTTDQTGTTQLEYGLTPALENGIAEHPDATKEHLAVLTGLAPDTVYHYRATSKSHVGPPFSREGTFQTPSAASVPAVPIPGLVLLAALIALGARHRGARLVNSAGARSGGS